ncbi:MULTISPECIES: hypothetical protein [unclassified Rathayibacter]|uniref:hypothetical protein n=1 Tax=unclassified Rathayibacter TaxID=2609250 RepID=UPI00105F2C39|nr:MULTISPECIES: hypothetical protein [unclassified Rathayibacter]
MIRAPHLLEAVLADASESPALLVAAATAAVAIALLVVLVAARLVTAPRALVQASAIGGVVVVGGPAVSRLLRFGDPTLPTPDLHPYLVLDPAEEALVVLAGDRRVEILWDEIRALERRTVGLGSRTAIGVTVSRGFRPRSADLRLVEEPGLLGLRAASAESVDRFHGRLRARVEAAGPASPDSR